MQSPFGFPPEDVRFIPENFFAPLPLADLFPGREGRPVEVDLGCGDGSFLIGLAQENPEHNFLGVERLLGRVRRTCRRAARTEAGATRGLKNVRVIRVESHYFLRYLLPKESVSVVHVMFPDPWPKRRHHHRRILQHDFLTTAGQALKPGGEIRFTTDDLPYFTHAEEVSAGHPDYDRIPWEPDASYPQTDFERGFRAKGLPIHRLLLRKRPAPALA